VKVETLDEGQERKRQRSPNFPSISLEKSLTFIQALYVKYKLSPVALEVVLKGLSLSPTSSVGMQIMAALGAYGLIEIEGLGTGKRIKISSAAYKIIADKRPVSPERDTLIRECALSPNIFRKIWEAYPDHFPPEDQLEYELTFTYKFNPSTVRDFIGVFRQTMDYAKVYDSDIIGDENQLVEDSPMMQITDKALSAKDSVVTRPPMFLPLAGEREIANFPIKDHTIRLLTAGPWNREVIKKLIKYLELSKDDFPNGDEQPENSGA
jgi:hypothetical protein